MNFPNSVFSDPWSSDREVSRVEARRQPGLGGPRLDPPPPQRRRAPWVIALVLILMTFAGMAWWLRQSQVDSPFVMGPPGAGAPAAQTLPAEPAATPAELMPPSPAAQLASAQDAALAAARDAALAAEMSRSQPEPVAKPVSAAASEAKVPKHPAPVRKQIEPSIPLPHDSQTLPVPNLPPASANEFAPPPPPPPASN